MFFLKFIFKVCFQVKIFVKLEKLHQIKFLNKWNYSNKIVFVQVFVQV